MGPPVAVTLLPTLFARLAHHLLGWLGAVLVARVANVLLPGRRTPRAPLKKKKNKVKKWSSFVSFDKGSKFESCQYIMTY